MEFPETVRPQGSDALGMYTFELTCGCGLGYAGLSHCGI